jgi:hypothetical protein
MVGMVTLEEAIGAELRRRREAAQGVTQEAVAAQAQAYGLAWTQATLAAIELGRRQLSVGEFAMLPLILNSAGLTGGRALGLWELLPDTDEDIDLTGAGEVGVPVRIVRGLFQPPAQAAAPSPAVPKRRRPGIGEAERKAARQFSVTPATIMRAARTLWGMTLTQRRDLLVSKRTDPMLRLDPAEARTPGWSRRLQAIRGHVTRELLEQLRPRLKGKVVTREKRKTR